jgi:hypothetical protein
MSQYKTLDKADIEAVFDKLIDENGQTTSLEVKEELRNQGFWATQAVVGVELRTIADAKGCDWDFNGTYRTYYEPGTQNMSPTPVQTTTVVPTAPKLPIPDDLRSALDTPSKDDWEAVAPGNGTMYFSGQLRPGQAKSLYVENTGADFLDVRVTRVQ